MFCFHSFQGLNLVQLHRAARRLKETQQIAADRPPRGGGGGEHQRGVAPSLKTRGSSWRSDTQRGRRLRQTEAGEVRQKMKDENGRKTRVEGREVKDEGSSSLHLIGCRHFITDSGELISICLHAIIAKVRFGFASLLLVKLVAC